MRAKLTCAAVIFALTSTAFVQADAIDASKITCEDFIFYRISNPNAITEWLSGYYHGKHDDPAVDPEVMQANSDKVRTYCQQQKNYKVTLMQAIEQILSTTNK
jgi:acid stress chaperone HdeB